MTGLNRGEYRFKTSRLRLNSFSFRKNIQRPAFKQEFKMVEALKAFDAQHFLESTKPKTSMVTLYFLGGEDVVKRDSRQINKKAFIDAGGAPVVLVFPWTAESVERADKYRKIMADYFKELGTSKIEFAELSDSLEEITKKMNRSDLVYLPGGVTKLLVQRIKDAKVDRLLRNYKKVIIGNSAGALVLSEDCILTRDKDNRETTVISGFGLVDFSVEVHYNPSKDKELKKLSEERRIYAIPEKCALIYANGNLSFVGNVYLFYKGKKTKC